MEAGGDNFRGHEEAISPEQGVRGSPVKVATLSIPNVKPFFPLPTSMAFFGGKFDPVDIPLVTAMSHDHQSPRLEQFCSNVVDIHMSRQASLVQEPDKNLDEYQLIFVSVASR